MKKLAMGVVILSVASLVGCVPCLRAIYTEKDVVFDPKLVGVWSKPDSGETWHFTKTDEKTYRLVHTDGKGHAGTFIVHLVKLDEMLFLDLYPDDPKQIENLFYKFHLVPVHTFLSVDRFTPMSVDGFTPTLRLSFMDPNWVKKLLEENPDAIRHEKVDGGILLTASTDQLQAFLIEHRKTEGAFGKPLDLQCKEAE